MIVRNRKHEVPGDAPTEAGKGTLVGATSAPHRRAFYVLRTRRVHPWGEKDERTNEISGFVTRIGGSFARNGMDFGELRRRIILGSLSRRSRSGFSRAR